MPAIVQAYGYPVAVTKSDTVDDPAGPFAGLLCTAAGTAIVWTAGPPAQQPVSIVVVAGQYLFFPVRRVGASSSNVIGLRSADVTGVK